MTDKTTTEIKLPEAIVQLAKKIEKDLSVGEGGVIALEKDFFESTLPEDLTMALVKKVQDHSAEVYSAAALALGRKAAPYLKKNKGVQGVTLSYAEGRNTADLRYDGEKTFPAMGGGEPRVSYGVTSGKYTVNGAQTSRGSLKKVRAHLMQEAAADKAK